FKCSAQLGKIADVDILKFLIIASTSTNIQLEGRREKSKADVIVFRIYAENTAEPVTVIIICITACN
ncbi:MAG TPA: hypothetical protein PK200_12120, partial [Spirochaetota bacterium]|nr:hypothetical protein [Spirochaetota bacterium]